MHVCVWEGGRSRRDYCMRSRRQFPKPEGPQATTARPLPQGYTPAWRPYCQTVHSGRLKPPCSWDNPVTGWSPSGQQQLVRNSELEGGSSTGASCATTQQLPLAPSIPSGRSVLSLVQVAQYKSGYGSHRCNQHL